MEKNNCIMTKKYIFLDRDGVIFKYRQNRYVNCVDDIEYIDGSLLALKKLHSAGVSVIVISNQAGVGKGLMMTEALSKITERMLDDAAKAGGEILDVFYCTHNVDENCDCRKPRPGLIFSAAKKYGFDPSKTYLIGDNISDIEAGRNGGCKTILVKTGNAALKPSDEWKAKPDFIEPDLLSAVKRVLNEDFGLI